MTLAEFLASGQSGIPVAALAADVPLAREVQRRLKLAGLLDPPDDGKFGAVSRWALAAFADRVDGAGSGEEADTEVLTRDVAARLADDDAVAQVFPLSMGKSRFADAVLAVMAKRGLWISRHPGCVNIIYLEGMDPAGTPNRDRPNEFNDTRLLLKVSEGGIPSVAMAWEATTEPGRYYTEVAPLDPNGAARIAFGQYKSWVVGIHLRSKPTSRHEALVQAEEVSVYRDKDRDYERTGDKLYKGIFGINQHWGYDLPKGDLGHSSAGCLVGRTREGHREFMALVKADARLEASSGYRFMTAILPGAEVAAAAA